MTDRDAYRRAQEIDGKLIAEMQAKEAQRNDRRHPPAGDRALRPLHARGHGPPRLFMSRMVALAGSAAAAEALVGALPPARQRRPRSSRRTTPRLTTGDADRSANGYSAYVAEPRTRSLKPTVMVIHENRGLNEHIRDVARRVALAGLQRRRARLPVAVGRHAGQ